VVDWVRVEAAPAPEKAQACPSVVEVEVVGAGSFHDSQRT